MSKDELNLLTFLIMLILGWASGFFLFIVSASVPIGG
jgi:hypothetical protein